MEATRILPLEVAAAHRSRDVQRAPRGRGGSVGQVQVSGRGVTQPRRRRLRIDASSRLFAIASAEESAQRSAPGFLQERSEVIAPALWQRGERNGPAKKRLLSPV